MRGLLLLISIVGFMGLILVWKFQTDPGVEAAPPPLDPSTGRIVVGTEAEVPAPALPAVAGPVVEPPYQPARDPALEDQARQPADAAPSSPEPGGDRVPALPEAAPELEPARVHYVVAEGDTLYSILRRTYGVAKPELIAAVADVNQLADPGALEIGQRLALPVVTGFPAPELP